MSFLLNAEELHYGVMESLRGGRGSQSGFSLASQRLASFTLPIALVPFCHGDVWYLSLSLLRDGFATNLYFRCRVWVRSNKGPQSGFSTFWMSMLLVNAEVACTELRVQWVASMELWFFFFVIFALSLSVLAHLVVPKCPAFLENLPAVQPRARILLYPPDVGRKWNWVTWRSGFKETDGYRSLSVCPFLRVVLAVNTFLSEAVL